MRMNAYHRQDWYQLQGFPIFPLLLQCKKADHLPMDRLSLALVPQTLHKYTKSNYGVLVKLLTVREVKEVR